MKFTNLITASLFLTASAIDVAHGASSAGSGGSAIGSTSTSMVYSTPNRIVPIWEQFPNMRFRCCMQTRKFPAQFKRGLRIGIMRDVSKKENLTNYADTVTLSSGSIIKPGPSGEPSIRCNIIDSANVTQKEVGIKDSGIAGTIELDSGLVKLGTRGWCAVTKKMETALRKKK